MAAGEDMGDLERRLKDAFDRVDKDGDGFLDLGEVSDVFRILQPDNPRRNKNLWHLMDQLDTKPPYGRIEWEEFKDFWLEKGGVDMTYGNVFTNTEWQDTLANPKLNSPKNVAVCPDSHIRHHHYEGSKILDTETVPNQYKVIKTLGQGHYASVHLVERVDGAEPNQSAMKIFYKSRLSQKEVHAVIREANLMRHVSGHKNIVEIHDLIETKQRLLLMVEPVLGGHLFSKIIAKPRQSFTEGDVARIMYQLIDALNYMHKNDIIHCDLKPENIMCTAGKSFDIKITDFGLSKHLVDDSKTLRSFVGTPLYAAPEVHGPPQDVLKRMRSQSSALQQQFTAAGKVQEAKDEARALQTRLRRKKLAYGAPSDLWSAGCIMFELLTGKPPFWRATTLDQLQAMLYTFEGILSAAPQESEHRKKTVYAKNMEQELKMAGVPPLGQDLVAMLLNPRPNPCPACFEKVKNEHRGSEEMVAAVKKKMLEESGNVELENMEEEVNMRAHQEFVLSLESDDPNIKASARAELYKEARRICSGKTVKKLTKQEEEAGVKQDLHCRISAEKALNHPWFNQALASEGPGLRSLADQVKQLSLSNSKRKLNRAISKILFMRRIICALRGSISGQLLMRQESSQNNRGEKDKGCSCNCSLM